MVKGEIEEVSVRVADLLNRLYKKIKIKKIDNKNFFYCEKGRYSHFGVYILHISILIILMGGIVGSLFLYMVGAIICAIVIIILSSIFRIESGVH